jgi:hypothetical protein
MAGPVHWKEKATNPNVQAGPDPDKLLSLAKHTLLGLAIIYVITIFAYMLYGEPAKRIFDTTANILPPIATLVIGFYFGKKQ